MFNFSGPLLTSKSWLNRALIIQHFNPDLKLDTTSMADDVLYLKRAIESLRTDEKKNSFDLGMGGTSFRFFVFLISRRKGHWSIRAHSRLLERPQQDLIQILTQLGVKVQSHQNEFQIISEGWLANKKIICSASLSSQFVSGVLLSSWGLEFDFEIEIQKPMTSFGYLQMTIELLREAGMTLVIEETEKLFLLKIPKNQRITTTNLVSELDVSSAFSLIAAAVINGKVEITNWQKKPKQPDLIFLDFFKQMNISFEIKDNIFSIHKHDKWNAINCHLNSAPDLFPVLAILCAFAQGVSTLSGASQLIYKESNRIKKTQELLDLVGIKSEFLDDGLRIYGQSMKLNEVLDAAKLRSNKDIKLCINQDIKLSFNPDHDHRMAMAAALLILKGYHIEITNPEVVTKSYPQFWQHIGLEV